MQVQATGTKAVFFGTILTLLSPMLTQPANASTPEHRPPAHHAFIRPTVVIRHTPAVHHVAWHHPATWHHPVYHHPAVAHRVAYQKETYRHPAAYHHPAAYRRPVPWHPVVYRHPAWHAPARHYVQHVTWHGAHTPVWHPVVARGISCVPYARIDSGIDLRGNAWQWWGHAAGIYARGQTPERGAVLAFRSNPRMPLGHVAVVSAIINRREVLINQANWSPSGHGGAIAKGVPVVDVSEANDWSAVRVGLGLSGKFGAVYPTYGFIYDRPDTNVQVAQARHAPAPEPRLNPAPGDLRPVAERPWSTYEEVAQAPATPRSAGPEARVYVPSGAVGAIDRK